MAQKTLNLPHGLKGKQVASRMLFLAYCESMVFGHGAFKQRSGVTEEQVWANATTKGDYPGTHPEPDQAATSGEVYADYCFGRMMKTLIQFAETSVSYPDLPPKRDYQSWCHAIPTYNDLANRAIKSLQKASAT